MPFPFTRREDHGEDMGLPGQKPQDFLILTIVGIQKALADEDEGHLGLLNLGLDDFMPWLPAEDLAGYEAVRQRVFAPAGMTGADFIPLDAVADNLAEGYVPQENEAGQTTWQKNIYSTTPAAAGDGGAVATAVDLHNFSAALRNGRLLSPERTQAMLTPHIQQKETPMRGYFWHYGFGNEFVFDPQKQLLRWGHTGEEDGVSCRFYHYPAQQLDVVILGNQSWCAGALGWQLHDLIQTHL